MTKISILITVITLFLSCKSDSTVSNKPKSTIERQEVLKYLKNEDAGIIANADRFLNQPPVPITTFKSERSAGTIHDFYSEGDYWWPDTDNPAGPYIRKDGLTNPENFVDHRQAVRNLNEWVSTLVAAFKITKDVKYANHAIAHLRAFFLDESSLMNPNLLYAQAIKGKHTGRGIGIIDTIHLIEVAKSILVLIDENQLPEEDKSGLKKWFNDYATWMNTHEYGLDEKDHGNNHSTWWAAQLAAFAELADRADLMDVARDQGKKLLSAQMESNGGFTDELTRTKPYIYMLFHLEGYATLCHIASDKTHDLWNYKGKNGSVKKAWDYMMPYIKDKSTWPFPPDVSHYDEVPIRSVGHLLAALAYDSPEYISIWKMLSPEKKSEEIKRNFPYFQPKLWIK